MGFSPRPAALPVPDPGERCSLTCQHYPQSAHSASCLSPLALPPLPIGPRSSPALSSQPSVPASSLGSWPPLFQPPVHPPRVQPWLPDHAGQSCFFPTISKAPPRCSLNAHLQFCAPGPQRPRARLWLPSLAIPDLAHAAHSARHTCPLPPFFSLLLFILKVFIQRPLFKRPSFPG